MLTVLLLSDERARERELCALFRGTGCRLVRVRSLEAWAQAERRWRPDVVLAAVADPRSALALRPRERRGFPPPVLFVRHETEPVPEVHLDERFVDFLCSPFLGEELHERLAALARVRRLILRRPFDEARRRSWWARRPRVASEDVRAAQGTRVAAALAQWSDGRDGFDPGHAERVAALAADLGLELGLTEEELVRLVQAARLHDVGKAALPASLLRQPAPLREEQVRLLRTHPARGAALLRLLGLDGELSRAVEEHHEAVNGSGYYGKLSAELSRLSRVLAVAEAFDAMTSSRVRPRCSFPQALEQMADQAGRRFDPEVVNALRARLRPRRDHLPLSH